MPQSPSFHTYTTKFLSSFWNDVATEEAQLCYDPLFPFSEIVGASPRLLLPQPGIGSPSRSVPLDEELNIIPHLLGLLSPQTSVSSTISIGVKFFVVQLGVVLHPIAKFVLLFFAHRPGAGRLGLGSRSRLQLFLRRRRRTRRSGAGWTFFMWRWLLWL